MWFQGTKHYLLIEGNNILLSWDIICTSLNSMLNTQAQGRFYHIYPPKLMDIPPKESDFIYLFRIGMVEWSYSSSCTPVWTSFSFIRCSTKDQIRATWAEREACWKEKEPYLVTFFTAIVPTATPKSSQTDNTAAVATNTWGTTKFSKSLTFSDLISVKQPCFHCPLESHSYLVQEHLVHKHLCDRGLWNTGHWYIALFPVGKNIMKLNSSVNC